MSNCSASEEDSPEESLLADGFYEKVNDEKVDNEDDVSAQKSYSNITLAYASVILVQVLNAGYNTLTKDALKKGKVDPLVFSLYRDAMAFPILFVLGLSYDGWIFPEKKDIWKIAVLGLCGMFGNQYFFIMGLKFIASDIASVLSLGQAIFASAIAVAVGQEAFSFHKVGGVVLCVGGAVVLLSPWNATGSGEVQGYLYILGSCICMAVYYIFQKPLCKKYPPLSLTAWSYFFGAFIMGLAATSKVNDGPKIWTLTSGSLVALAFAVVCNSVMKYALQSFVNKHLAVTILTAWSTSVPVFTAVFAYLDPNQTETLGMQDLGFFPIVAGLFLVKLSSVSGIRLERIANKRSNIA
jgi:drug/metabolite transporter (DMT)-like permease